MLAEIRCDHQDGTGEEPCNRFLAELDAQGILWLYCPKCRCKHPVRVAALMEILLKQLPAHEDGGKGFML